MYSVLDWFNKKGRAMEGDQVYLGRFIQAVPLLVIGTLGCLFWVPETREAEQAILDPRQAFLGLWALLVYIGVMIVLGLQKLNPLQMAMRLGPAAARFFSSVILAMLDRSRSSKFDKRQIGEGLMDGKALDAPAETQSNLEEGGNDQ